ncbi:hypothetical protein [Chondrinema litorale]|uniref:hypothetical protein n=1 Tax=Chondrinema litorale TaxID=2994555 RepID=UPI00254271C9|nr:hypothetical protein [Chondrinema litorale]UZR94925.1 hypothetical protein OQ292_03745 [Chondrinema litorale]
MKKKALFSILTLGFLITVGVLSGFKDVSEPLKTVKLRKVSKLKLGAKGGRVLKKYFPNLKMEGDMALPPNGYTFYFSKVNERNGLIFIADKVVAAEVGDSMEVYEPQWAKIGVAGNLWMVCSCGSNVMASSGDGCQWNDTNKSCDGNCSQGNLGKKCGVTTIDMETGTIHYTMTE